MLAKKSAIYSVSIILMFDYLGYGILIPIMPQLFLNHEFGLLGSNVSEVVREFLYGIVLSLLSFTSLFGMPFICSMAGKYGRKKVLFISAGLLVFNYIFSAVSIILHSIWMFVFSRIFAGILEGVYPLTDTIAGDLGTSTHESVHNFRVISIMTTLGLVISPVIALFADSKQVINRFAFPFILASIITILGVSFAIYLLRNVSLVGRVTDNETSGFSSINLIAGIKYLLMTPHMRFVTIAYVLFEFGIGLMALGMSLYLTIVVSYSVTEISLFVSLMYFIMLLSSYLLPKILSRYLNYKNQVLFALIVLSIILMAEFIVHKFIGPILSYHYIGMWIAFGTFFAIRPIIEIIFNSVLASSVETSKRAMALGGAGQLFAISRGIAAIVLGILMRHKMVLGLSAIALFISFILLMIHFRLTARSEALNRF